jgi:hypothetical protein
MKTRRETDPFSFNPLSFDPLSFGIGTPLLPIMVLLDPAGPGNPTTVAEATQVDLV